MKEIYVRLDGADAVQKFVEALTGLEGDFDLVSGRYILDARSLMGIFSLDLSRPILLRVHKGTPDTLKALAPFTVAPPEDTDA